MYAGNSWSHDLSRKDATAPALHVTSAFIGNITIHGSQLEYNTTECFEHVECRLKLNTIMLLAKTQSNKPTGVPSEYFARLRHLRTLLQNLPSTLPNNPEMSSYNFACDADDLEAEGFWYALNRNLEVCFETYQGPITIRERGSRITGVVPYIQDVLKHLSPAEREITREKWIEGIISAALRAGARSGSAVKYVYEH